ncbi:hypothetical protein ACL02R_09050 [Streptomyces sp. MS19]|uniref:hypothetical protein n=1 Tax=Streptomyces sp. MS19 TaxID=3385972 RepID=UPI0039A2C1E3
MPAPRRRRTAHAHFTRAAARIDAVPPGPYADWVRYAVAQGLRDTGPAPQDVRPGRDALGALLASLCARADLKALAVLLPAYVGDLGTEEDRTRLTTALHLLHAGRSLPDADQATASRALAVRTARAVSPDGTAGRVAPAM